MSSWVVIGKPCNFANFKILYVYFKCVFNILLFCFMFLICDTKINNYNNNPWLTLTFLGQGQILQLRFINGKCENDKFFGN